MPAKTSAHIRMYRLHELGDCFLLTFKSGGATSRMLVDCGSFRNGSESAARLREITGAIKDELGGDPLNVVVGTHQHNDHVSGFVHCEDTFREMKVDQVWLSWLDNPADRKARQIGRTHRNLQRRLAAVRDRLHAALKRRGASRSLNARSLDVLNDVLGFAGAHTVGAAPELPEKGVQILKALGKSAPQYLKPGRTLEMPGLPQGSVRIHVLGPPRKDDLLYRKDPRKGESYDHSLALANLQAAKFLNALEALDAKETRSDENHPFNSRYQRKAGTASPALKRMIQRYASRVDDWRTIDDDWLQQAEALALYMDTFTNNSSLVLAIELMESRKVLLFAADAQTGNWLSWAKVKWEDSKVSTEDLLARTVFYKVGHHASHNATLVEVFEKLCHPQLMAFIPVHKKDPNITKKNGWKMPARELFKRIVEKTDHRVLQMDNANPPSCDPRKEPAKSAWARAGVEPKITPLAIEVQID